MVKWEIIIIKKLKTKDASLIMKARLNMLDFRGKSDDEIFDLCVEEKTTQSTCVSVQN